MLVSRMNFGSFWRNTRSRMMRGTFGIRMRVFETALYRRPSAFHFFYNPIPRRCPGLACDEPVGLHDELSSSFKITFLLSSMQPHAHIASFIRCGDCRKFSLLLQRLSKGVSFFLSVLPVGSPSNKAQRAPGILAQGNALGGHVQIIAGCRPVA